MLKTKKLDSLLDSMETSNKWNGKHFPMNCQSYLKASKKRCIKVLCKDSTQKLKSQATGSSLWPNSILEM